MEELSDKYIDKAIVKYGSSFQLNTTNEESSELIKAISRYLVKPNQENSLNILREIIDLEMMIRILKRIFSFTSDQIREIREEKVKRFKERVDSKDITYR